MKPLTSSLIVALFVLSGNLGVRESSAAADELATTTNDWYFDWLFGNDVDQPDLRLGLDVGISVLDTSDDDSVLLESQVTAEVVPYYVIQVEYAYPERVRSRPGWVARGPYGNRPRRPRPAPEYALHWVTIAESTSLEDAEWIYAWYAAAWLEGALDELAPAMGNGSYPTRVQLITEYRPVTETLLDD